jgi:uncharacterized membrane protein YoaT (DUF817 family)
VGLQVVFLAFRLETWGEARVILLFHITGTLMEVFKVHAGSWTYPDPGVIRIYDVPLFTGFMYAAVGSFIARSIRLFDLRFTPYPHFGVTLALAIAIYLNFYSHHFLPDVRVLLFLATLLVFGRTWVSFQCSNGTRGGIPMVFACLGTSFALWIAENIGTATETWLYSGQVAGDIVPFAKMGSWYLLIYVSFVTVTLVYRQSLARAPSKKAVARPLATQALPAAQ